MEQLALIDVTPEPTRPERWPLAPLLRELSETDGRADRLIAELCGVSVRTAQRWLADHAIPDEFCDQAACGLGLHPDHLWSGWCEAGPFRPTPAQRMRHRARARHTKEARAS